MTFSEAYEAYEVAKLEEERVLRIWHVARARTRLAKAKSSVLCYQDQLRDWEKRAQDALNALGARTGDSHAVDHAKGMVDSCDHALYSATRDLEQCEQSLAFAKRDLGFTEAELEAWRYGDADLGVERAKDDSRLASEYESMERAAQ